MCLLCNETDIHSYLGPILPSAQSHLLCVRFASGIQDKTVPPTDSVFIKEVRRCRKLKCVYCRKLGAAVGCVVKSCRRTYHLACGVSHQALNQHDVFVSYCKEHQPRQIKVEEEVSEYCSSCNLVVEEDGLTTPCCRTTHHRQCLQMRASLAHADCPNCGDLDKYTDEMNFYGIYFRMAEEKNYVSAASSPPGRLVLAAVTKDRRSSSASSSSSRSRSSSPALIYISSSPPVSPVRSPAAYIIPTSSLAASSVPSPVPSPTDQIFKSSPPTSPVRSPTGPVIPESSLAVSSVPSPESSDGPLSDIDDLLGGNENPVKPEVKRPYLSSISDPANKEPSSLSSTENKQTSQVRNKENSQSDDSTSDELRLKQRSRKPRKKKPSPRKTLLLKQTALKSRDLTDDNDDDEKEEFVHRRKRQIRPLSSRQIYHGRNWVLKAGEEEEEECDSGWMTEHNTRNINDFTDLNEGEKSFLNLWNLHMDTLVNHGVGFGHMRDILECFLSNHGHSIVQLNLYRNFLLHLSSLHRLSLISSRDVFELTISLQSVMKVLPTTVTVLAPAWYAQHKNWRDRVKREGPTATSTIPGVISSDRTLPDPALPPMLPSASALQQAVPRRSPAQLASLTTPVQSVTSSHNVTSPSIHSSPSRNWTKLAGGSPAKPPSRLFPSPSVPRTSIPGVSPLSRRPTISGAARLLLPHSLQDSLTPSGSSTPSTRPPSSSTANPRLVPQSLHDSPTPSCSTTTSSSLHLRLSDSESDDSFHSSNSRPNEDSSGDDLNFLSVFDKTPATSKSAASNCSSDGAVPAADDRTTINNNRHKASDRGRRGSSDCRLLTVMVADDCKLAKIVNSDILEPAADVNRKRRRSSDDDSDAMTGGDVTTGHKRLGLGEDQRTTLVKQLEMTEKSLKKVREDILMPSGSQHK